MSEGSRGTQAPSRPDDESLDDGSQPNSNGNGSGQAQSESGEDFYATVNSAAASRSTRVRRAEGAERPDSANGASRAAAAPATEGDSAQPKSDASSAAAHGTTGATAARAAAEPKADDAPTGAHAAGDSATTDSAATGKSWRERWSSLSSAVTGKPKADMGEEAAAHSARQPAKQPEASAPAAAETTAAQLAATQQARAKPDQQARAKADQPKPSAAPKAAAAAKGVDKPARKASADAPTESVPVQRPVPAPVTGRTASPTSAPAAAAAGAGAGVAASSTATAVRTPTSPAEKVEPARAGAAKPKIGAAHRTRKARLRMSRIDPWSVMKTAFLFSIAAGIVLVVAIYVIWTVIGSSGLFTSINDIVGSVVSTPGDTTPFRIEEYVNTQKVMGVTAFVACIDVVIFTALATLASFLYNLAATMLGGLEVTLAED